MTSTDSDFRYMATNDLLVHLQNETSFDESTERKIVASLLKLLQDSNGEVQNMTIKCLGPLVNHVRPQTAFSLAQEICKLLSDKKEVLRDVSAMGLKSLVSQMNPDSDTSQQLLQYLVPQLVQLLSQNASLDIIDILTQILVDFKDFWKRSQPAIQMSLLKELLVLLEHQRPVVRKRVIQCLGALANVGSDQTQNDLVNALLIKLKDTSDDSLAIQTLVSCFSILCKSNVSKLNPFMGQILKSTIGFLEIDDDDCKEQCLQALEVFSTNSFSAFDELCPQIIDLAIEYCQYDPNYNDDDMELDEDSDEEDFSDNEDVSWKVRRASCKLLQSLFTFHPKYAHTFVNVVCPFLIKRFNERQENVKMDMMNTLAILIQQVVLAKPVSTSKRQKRNDGSASPFSDQIDESLQKQLPTIVKAIVKQFSTKSEQTIHALFHLLQQLAKTSPLLSQFDVIYPVIEQSLSQTKKTNLKLDCLEFLIIFIHGLEYTQALKKLVPLIIGCCQDQFYRVSAEAFAIVSQLIKIMRPESEMAHLDQEAELLGLQLFETTWSTVSSNQDAEVRNQSLLSLGVIVKHIGNLIPEQRLQSEIVPFLVDKISNETTRLTGLQVIQEIGASPLTSEQVKNSLKQSNVVQEIAQLLILSHQPTRLHALQALEALIKMTDLEDAVYETILQHLIPVLNSQRSDVQLMPRLFSLCCSILKRRSFPIIKKDLIPCLVDIVKQVPHMVSGGAGLDNLVELMRLLSLNNDQTNVYELGILKLLDIKEKESVTVAAKCIGAFTGPLVKDLVQKLVKGAQESQTLFILALGELGYHKEHQQLIPPLNDLIFSLFQSQSEDVKNAGAYCLGRVACGNAQYLNLIVDSIRSKNYEYLSLLALKETLTLVTDLKQYSQDLFKILFERAAVETEEGTRNVIAECLGNLAIGEPRQFLPLLQQLLTSENAPTRSTVVNAVKFTFSSNHEDYDQVLSQILIDFLRLINDPELLVRKSTLSTLNAAAHSKPLLVQPFLQEILPLLYEQTKVRDDLIVIVEMGPFKHRVDTGLDARKTAYECMSTLMDSLMQQVPLVDFLDHVIRGLGDPAHDIKILSHYMVQKLIKSNPNAVSAKLDLMAGPLKDAVDSKTKKNAVKQELEKWNELVSSSLRTIVKLSPLGGPFPDMVKLYSATHADKMQ
ncbi:armadillo-type protein [Gorgonomyces haynaldii]|nr:armadillo-type protein [Gorgonomyces haynaldii]